MHDIECFHLQIRKKYCHTTMKTLNIDILNYPFKFIQFQIMRNNIFQNLVE